MQTIASRLIKGIMLLLGVSGCCWRSNPIFKFICALPADKRIIRTNLPYQAGKVRERRKNVFSPDFRRQWKLFCLPGLRRFGRFSAVHFDQIQH
ncbi:MAG: hypothetical protein V8R10_03450 [Christensenellales bacterium]